MNEPTTNSIAGNAKQLLTSPSRFFSLMPKSGGFGEPLVFILAMAVAAALLCALGAIPGQGIVAAFKILIGKSILWSIYAVLGVFLASVAFFFIWKVLGSQCSYETAFRCTAYTTVMLPVILLLSLVPVVGVAIGLLWAAWLLVAASTAAHGLPQQKPLLIFGLLALLAIWRAASCDCGDDNAATAGKVAADAKVDVTELEPVKVVVTAEPLTAGKASKAAGDASPAIDPAADAEASAQLSAENAGRALGELVKGVTDMAKNVGGDIAKGLDSTLQGALPDQQAAENTEPAADGDGESTFSLDAASESVGETVGALVKSLGEVARDASEGLQKALEGETAEAESNASAAIEDSSATDGVVAAGEQSNADAVASGGQITVPDMSPEQLGEALGTFINKLNAAANSAAEGFERGQQQGGDAALNYTKAPAQEAGEALGRFMRSFNQALRELEAQAPEAQPER